MSTDGCVAGARATPEDVLAGRARWCVVEDDALALLASLPDGCVDAVVTDPPYGVGWRSKSWDADIPPQRALDECLRASRGCVLWFGGASRLLDLLRYQPSPDRVIAWAPPFTMSSAATGGLLHHWDPIVVWRLRVQRWSRVFADVVRHARARASDAWWDHGCTKPIALMRDLVATFSPQESVVLDPFAGSGTTGVAALAEGRRVILCERDHDYAEIARRRCEAAERGTDWRAPASQLGLFDADLADAIRARGAGGAP